MCISLKTVEDAIVKIFGNFLDNSERSVMFHLNFVWLNHLWLVSGPQGPQLQKVLERLTGQHTVPNVFVG